MAVGLGWVPAGAEYPWYLAVLHPPVAILAGLGATVAVDRLRRPAVPLVRRAVAGVLLAGLSLTVVYPVVSAVGERPPSAHDERFDRQMPAALDWLAPRVAPGEVVRTCFGAPALALPEAVIDDPCGLTTKRAPGPFTWEVTTLAPDQSGGWAAAAGTCVAFAPPVTTGPATGSQVVVLRADLPGPTGIC